MLSHISIHKSPCYVHIFSHFKTLNHHTNIITLNAIEKEYISIITYSLNYLNPHAVQPQEFWKTPLRER